jgi:hypothetical protein
MRLAPGADAFIGCFQIGFFEEIGLGFPFCCCEDEVVWDDGEFVEDERVGGGRGWEGGY